MHQLLMGSSASISQGLFLKFLGGIYFFAFLSLNRQVKGLYGSQGIASIRTYLDTIHRRYGKKLFVRLPTLFWFNTSDRCLVLVTWVGMLGAAFVLAGIIPALFLFVLWMCYLSFCQAGGVFLSYQWDALLVEAGFLSIFFAIQSPPPLPFVYLLWFLLFRLMFSSALAKLLWGSQEWKNLTAMVHHYETQPLPTILGYYAHQQPLFFAKLSVIGVYFFELVMPCLIFTPVPIRCAASLLLVFFQLLIMATGNYAFLNLLTIALCLPLIPNLYLSHFEGLSWFIPLVSANLVIGGLLSVFALIFLLMNALELMAVFLRRRTMFNRLRPFYLYHLINPYGLFIHMTTVRDEIIVEGSDDGREWKVYEFKWKPGNPFCAPRFAAPHQPRLDWQMWFAALGSYTHNPWFSAFLSRLLEGSEDVLRLLKDNPFPRKPPKYVRSRLYRYHFTDRKIKKETGMWWSRVPVGEYSPTFSLVSNPALDDREAAPDGKSS